MHQLRTREFITCAQMYSTVCASTPAYMHITACDTQSATELVSVMNGIVNIEPGQNNPLRTNYVYMRSAEKALIGLLRASPQRGDGMCFAF